MLRASQKMLEPFFDATASVYCRECSSEVARVLWFVFVGLAQAAFHLRLRTTLLVLLWPGDPLYKSVPLRGFRDDVSTSRTSSSLQRMIEVFPGAFPVVKGPLT
jgi:hypothetical protein